MKAFGLLRSSLLLLLAPASAGFAQNYTIVDIGTPPGYTFATPRAINSSGWIAGATGSGATSSVFIYHNGKFTILGTLGGNSGIGNGINASGQVAGYSTNAAGTYRAFISKGDKLIDIGDLGGGSAVAYAINDKGEVVGSSVNAYGSNDPFLYRDGKMIDLGTLGSPQGSGWWNTALGVNNAGVAVGYSYTDQDVDPLLGFAWFDGKMSAMGSLGGDMSQSYAVNNHNQATGIAYLANGTAHAFIVNPTGKMKDLGSLTQEGDSWGFAINDSGVVVGQALADGGNEDAFISRGGPMQDLNSLVVGGSGLRLIDAHGINKLGQIVCDALDSQGNSHAVLLTPQ
jgi:probable HAF family extracellular repeat protein